MHKCILAKDRKLAFAHNSSLPLVAPAIVGAPNRAYLASCLRHSAQIPRYARNFKYAQPLSEILAAIVR